ncbi:MAG: molybdopterin-binding protein [Aequorivita sp.]
MKRLFTLFLLLITLSVCAQKDFAATDSFVVKGEVKTELEFNLADIEKYESKQIDDVLISNHRGEARSNAKQLSGVLVKNLLRDLELNAESPKVLSEFHLTFISIDGYKAVYSWNEIFNSATGDNVFIITSRDGKTLSDMGERILVMTPTDFKTGRRHIKKLSEINVQRVK